jgi:branched-chain amino acid transport system substrate-binding protein
MAPILSQGNLATITPSSTNPDITDPKFALQFRSAGKASYFRTVTTDAYHGPNMANYFAQKLKVKKVFIIDDTGAYGVGIADAFEAQARKTA